jgi:hypothetical protein
MSEIWDAYLRRNWPRCPVEVKNLVGTEVVPASRASQDTCATDSILWKASNCTWYEKALLFDRQQFHKLVGHVVRIARNYEVARTPSGRPIRLRSKCGPHKTFTMQVPRRAAS